MGNSSRMPRGIHPERVGYAAAGVILLEFKKVPDILRAEISVQRGPGGLETPTSARRAGRTSGLAAPSALIYATRRPRAPQAYATNRSEALRTPGRLPCPLVVLAYRIGLLSVRCGPRRRAGARERRPSWVLQTRLHPRTFVRPHH